MFSCPYIFFQMFLLVFWDLNVILRIIEILVPIGITCFGYLVFWPNYKKQKRIESQILDAKKALHLILNLEEYLVDLKEKVHNSNSQIPDPIHKDIHEKIIKVIRELRLYLDLLNKGFDLENRDISRSIAKHFEKIEEILNNKSYPLSAFQSIDILAAFDLLDKRYFDDEFINRLNELKQSLISICQAS